MEAETWELRRGHFELVREDSSISASSAGAMGGDLSGEKFKKMEKCINPLELEQTKNIGSFCLLST